jgi:DNA-binding response OmpR family regulator
VKILYLEDNRQEAALVSRYVQTTAHEFMLALTLDEARQAVAAQPELVMVDLVLGHTRDGYRFIRELRGQGYSHPIVAVTGLTAPRDLQECRAIGADAVLVKPFTINQLADVIHEYAS